MGGLVLLGLGLAVVPGPAVVPAHGSRLAFGPRRPLAPPASRGALQMNALEREQLEQPRTSAERRSFASVPDEVVRERTADVIVAGGGIGGLCTALVLINQGYDVKVFEKAQAYKPFGGPIQIASNALESIKRIDKKVHARILEEATVIGDRTNGLKDGVSNEWFATFDLYAPARKRNQEVSIVIDRPILQGILLERVGGCVTNGAEVIGCVQGVGRGVTAILEDGSRVTADLLVGSDGIRSKIRTIIDPDNGDAAPIWSGYTCFAAIANCVPHDIESVGYKVFLGSRKYFVSVDVGGGRIQWYAFLNIPPRSMKLEPGSELQWLKETQFKDWNEEVHELIDSTPVDQVEQRDLFDRAPQLSWTQGRVCLLGDAVHPMMPNLGQGGGMAIEDALVLGQELRKAGSREELPLALRRYEQNRVLRAAAVQGMSRASSAILFQYNSPTSLVDGQLKNLGPRSLITRACQGFLQNVAFPLQFEYLFSFPKSIDPQVFAPPMQGDFGTEDAKSAEREAVAAHEEHAKKEGPAKIGEAEEGFLNAKDKGDWFKKYW